MAANFVYTAVFTFLMASGQPMESDDASYKTYDACMTESEASAKLMAREWEWTEREGRIQPFKGVAVRCEKRPAPRKVARHASK